VFAFASMTAQRKYFCYRCESQEAFHSSLQYPSMGDFGLFGCHFWRHSSLGLSKSDHYSSI